MIRRSFSNEVVTWNRHMARFRAEGDGSPPPRDASIFTGGLGPGIDNIHLPSENGQVAAH